MTLSKRFEYESSDVQLLQADQQSGQNTRNCFNLAFFVVLNRGQPIQHAFVKRIHLRIETKLVKSEMFLPPF